MLLRTKGEQEAGSAFTPQELEGAYVEICNALASTYKDARGRTLKVERHLSKYTW